MAEPKRFKVWLVRWDWAGEHAAVEKVVAALLKPQASDRQVMAAVELLYATHQYTGDDMLEAMRRGGHNPYRARLEQHMIVCGHNPFLIAQRASVWRSPGAPDGIEWELTPRPAAFDLNEIEHG
jgi:hypothetical protein